MESDIEVIDHHHIHKPPPVPIFPNLFLFFTKFISLQANIISTCILSLASPFFSIVSLLSDLLFRRRTPPAKDDHDDSDTTYPTRSGGSILLGRIAVGLLAAAYVCVVLLVVAVLAAVLGVGLVRAWAEEPVYMTESLQFDYAEAHPTAVLSFGNSVPVRHTLYVSLLLLMPESDYNRDLGIFQLTAELKSLQGDLVAKSSRPCMLRFRSWPIRFARTFLMGVPLLLGITTETQTIAFPILKHKESSFPRTEYLRITLIPRAGTLSLPQFYDAQIVVKSRPPWTKEFVYRWKWTFYVWTTTYIFVLLVMFLVFFLKPLIFPVMATRSFAKYDQHSAGELEPPEAVGTSRDEREVSESLRRWQRSRSKRKAALLHGVMPESESAHSSEATSISVTRAGLEEGSGDSESVCFRGQE